MGFYGVSQSLLPKIKNIVYARDMALFLVIVAAVALSPLYAPAFLTALNLYTMLKTLPELGIIVLGVAFLMISEEFDLSIGSTFAFAPLVMAILFGRYGINIWIAFPIGLLAGAGIGAINGLVTTKFRIHSFIVTLGGMMVWRGATMVLSRGFPERFSTPPIFRAMFTGTIGDYFPVQIIWLIAIVFLLWILLDRHQYGNWVFTTGGNRAAAEARGINTARVKVINFMMVGILAAFAGAMRSTRVSYVYAVQGLGFELQAIAAVVVGGTSLAGGVGSIRGAFLGVFLVVLIDRSIILAGIGGFWFQIFLGLLIVGAVLFHKLTIWGKGK